MKFTLVSYSFVGLTGGSLSTPKVSFSSDFPPMVFTIEKLLYALSKGSPHPLTSKVSVVCMDKYVELRACQALPAFYLESRYLYYVIFPISFLYHFTERILSISSFR